LESNVLQQVNRKVLVADGAMGTMLQKRGLPIGHCPEAWNLSRPDDVAAIHEAYFKAGSDLVETNTFGGNKFRLAHHGLTENVREINQKAAEIARAVCPQGKYVAGSVGPTGEFMEPIGSLTFDALVDVFHEQIEALCKGGVDLIIVETMMDVQEAAAGITAAKKVASSLPVFASMTFERVGDGYKTMMGCDILTMMDKLIPVGADVIGANCGKGMYDMLEIISELRKLTPHPLLAQSNAGIPEWDGEKNIYRETPQQRAISVQKLLQFDINVVGGCCGTTPEHIKTTRDVVDHYNSIRMGKESGK